MIPVPVEAVRSTRSAAGEVEYTMLITSEELSLIAAKLALPHRTQDDWAPIKDVLLERDVFVMESATYPSIGHMTVADGAVLVFTTKEKCTDWIDKYAPHVRFVIGSLPYSQAIEVADEHRRPLYLDMSIGEKFIAYRDKELAARVLVETKAAKVGPNDPCPCGSGKKYKKCCGR